MHESTNAAFNSYYAAGFIPDDGVMHNHALWPPAGQLSADLSYPVVDGSTVAAPVRCLRSVPDQAERVSCGVSEYAPTPLSVATVEQRGAPLEHAFLSLVQVLDPEVEVELLGAGGVQPLRRLMVLHALEGQHEPSISVESRPAFAERPPRIRLVHHAAEKRLVELGQLSNIGTVQHDTLQLRDHAGQHLTRRDHDLRSTGQWTFAGE